MAELRAPLDDGPELVGVEEEVDGFLSGTHCQICGRREPSKPGAGVPIKGVERCRSVSTRR